jgi:CO/xanthine dehydrogenase FAD-binding subunit
MIIEYHRPTRKEEAFALLSRKTPKTVPLGGGTLLSQSRKGEDLAVVDLQALGMRDIQVISGNLQIGANVTLQKLIAYPEITPAFRTSLVMECNFNLRQMSTIGGTLASISGGSAFHALLMAAEADIELEPEKRVFRYSEFSPQKSLFNPGFISALRIPLGIKTSLKSVSRTPESESIICLCGAITPNQTIRITMTRQDLPKPQLIFAGNNPKAEAIPNPYPPDAYKSSVFSELVGRVLTDLEGGK